LGRKAEGAKFPSIYKGKTTGASSIKGSKEVKGGKTEVIQVRKKQEDRGSRNLRLTSVK